MAMQNEIRVISAVVNNKDIAPTLSGGNVDQLFDTHRDVWDFMKEYYYKYRSVVPKDIISENFPDVELVETSGEVKHYVEQLKSEYQTAMLARIAKGISKDIYNLPPDKLIDVIQGKMTDLVSMSTSVRDLDITDADKANDHYIEKKQLMEAHGGVLGIRSGFDSIDAHYHTGFAPGQYITVLSRTGQGKSFFAVKLAINAWLQGKKVLYVSLEMPAESLRDRAYTFMSEGEFGLSALSRAEIDLEKIKSWTNDQFNTDGSFIVTASDSMGEFSPTHLQAKIDQYAPDIVFVDYLQLMADRRNSSGSTERVRNTSKEVKSVAMVNNVPIVMIAAASMNESKEYFDPPQIYECAESKQAVYDVDLCLALISEKLQDPTGNIFHKMEVVARKNRHGADFAFQVKMDIANGLMTEGFGEDAF
jgi:replicative DNA helicase